MRSLRRFAVLPSCHSVVAIRSAAGWSLKKKKSSNLSTAENNQQKAVDTGFSAQDGGVLPSLNQAIYREKHKKGVDPEAEAKQWRDFHANLADVTDFLPTPKLVEVDSMPCRPDGGSSSKKSIDLSRQFLYEPCITTTMVRAIDHYLKHHWKPFAQRRDDAASRGEWLCRRLRQVLLKLERANGFGRSDKKRIGLATPLDLKIAIQELTQLPRQSSTEDQLRATDQETAWKFILQHPKDFTVNEHLVRANRHLELEKFLWESPAALGDQLWILKGQVMLRSALCYIIDEPSCAFDFNHSGGEKRLPDGQPLHNTMPLRQYEDMLQSTVANMNQRRVKLFEFVRKKADPFSRGSAPSNKMLYRTTQASHMARMSVVASKSFNLLEPSIVLPLAADALAMRAMNSTPEEMRAHMMKVMSQYERWVLTDDDVVHLAANSEQWRQRIVKVPR